jgi:hypothetical protein
MSEIKQFEDLDLWQKARDLTRLIYELSSIGDFTKDFGLRDQIRRAAVSILSNISEKAIDLSRMISGFMKYLQNSSLKGK